MDAGGAVVFFPPGNYIINGGLTLDNAEGVVLRGSGLGSGYGEKPLTRLKRTSGTETMLTVTGTSPITHANQAHIEIRDLEFDGSGSPFGKGIHLNRVNDCYVHRVHVHDCTAEGLQLTQVYNTSISQCRLSVCGAAGTPAFSFDANAESQGACNTVEVDGISFEGNRGVDLKITGDEANDSPATNIHFANMKFEQGTATSLGYPYIHCEFAYNIDFANVVVIVNSVRTVAPIKVEALNPGVGEDRSVRFVNTAVDNINGSFDYFVEQLGATIQMSNCLFWGSADTSHVYIDSAVRRGGFQAKNVKVTDLGIPFATDNRTNTDAYNNVDYPTDPYPTLSGDNTFLGSNIFNKAGASPLLVASGIATNYTYLGVGRTGDDLIVGVAGGAGDLSANTVAGDGVIRALTTRHLFIGAGDNANEIRIENDKLGFFNTTPRTQPNVTGSRGGNAALADLLTALDDLGLITDSTTA